MEGKSFIPRSEYEEWALLELKTDRKVDKYFYESLSIPYTSPFAHGPRTRNYTPDILVYYTNNKRVIVEVKSILEAWTPENLAKFKAADDHAKSTGCDFEVWVYGMWDNSKSIYSFQDIVDEIYFLNHDTWFALSQWVKDEGKMNAYWEKFALEVGNELKNGSGISGKETKMRQCWKQAVKHGFIP